MDPLLHSPHGRKRGLPELETRLDGVPRKDLALVAQALQQHPHLSRYLLHRLDSAILRDDTWWDGKCHEIYPSLILNSTSL